MNQDHTQPPLDNAASIKTKAPVRNVNIEYHRKLSPIDRFALWSAERIGSIGFFFLILFWTICWFLWNTLMTSDLQFDPYPQFALWIFVSNTIQLMLMPLILAGQNLMGRHAEERSEADYEVNVKAEHEIKVLLERLDRQEKLLAEIIAHLRRDHDCDDRARHAT